MRVRSTSASGVNLFVSSTHLALRCECLKWEGELERW